MEPITTTLALATAADVVKDEIKSAIGDFFKDTIVARWSNYRAEQFFTAFLDEVRKEDDVRTRSADLNDMLREISDKADRTSALFDAYRRVALSGSRKIGPQVIGMLVARVVLENRDATEEEEQIFDAAEALNDREFSSFLAWMEFARTHTSYTNALAAWATDGGGLDPASVLVSGLVGPDLGSQLDVEGFFPSSSFNLYRDVGPFAAKLTIFGLMEESAQPRGLSRDPKGSNYYLLVTPACERFYKLALRALGHNR